MHSGIDKHVHTHVYIYVYIPLLLLNITIFINGERSMCVYYFFHCMVRNLAVMSITTVTTHINYY